MLPSSRASLTPVTVTVCGTFQFAAVKVRLAGRTVPSVVSLELRPIVTSAVGCVVEHHREGRRPAGLGRRQARRRRHRDARGVVVGVGDGDVGGVDAVVGRRRRWSPAPSRSCRRRCRRPGRRRRRSPSPSAPRSSWRGEGQARREHRALGRVARAQGDRHVGRRLRRRAPP